MDISKFKNIKNFKKTKGQLKLKSTHKKIGNWFRSSGGARKPAKEGIKSTN